MRFSSWIISFRQRISFSNSTRRRREQAIRRAANQPHWATSLETGRLNMTARPRLSAIMRRTLQTGTWRAHASFAERLEDRTLLAAAFPEFLDPNPNAGNQFGATASAGFSTQMARSELETCQKSDLRLSASRRPSSFLLRRLAITANQPAHSLRKSAVDQRFLAPLHMHPIHLRNVAS